MTGKVTHGRKRIELLHDKVESIERFSIRQNSMASRIETKSVMNLLKIAERDGERICY